MASNAAGINEDASLAHAMRRLNTSRMLSHPAKCCIRSAATASSLASTSMQATATAPALRSRRSDNCNNAACIHEPGQWHDGGRDTYFSTSVSRVSLSFGGLPAPLASSYRRSIETTLPRQLQLHPRWGNSVMLETHHVEHYIMFASRDRHPQ